VVDELPAISDSAQPGILLKTKRCAVDRPCRRDDLKNPLGRVPTGEAGHGSLPLWFAEISQKNVLLQVLASLQHIFRFAEIAPIIFIGPKGEDFFSAASQTQIRGDDGERSLLNCHREKTRGNNVDAGKSQCLHLP
jgi:hypothetical protein